MGPTHIRRSVTVTGRVQGVSFRWYATQTARRLACTGWVRNEPDGSVRLEVQGPASAVEQFVDWAHRGPDQAQVADVEVEDLAPVEGESDFRTVR